jgi:pilus assembly protein CpaF
MPGIPEEILASRLLKPLSVFIESPDTVEVRMVRAEQVIIERRFEEKIAVEADGLVLGVLETICQALANRHGLKFDPDEMPKLSCVLPGGHRFECLLGSSVRSGLSLAIRCKHPFIPTWAQLGVSEAMRRYLLAAVRDERNMIISGATNTGKTTLLNMLLGSLPEERRVIAVEDTPELDIDKFWDGVGLIAARESNASDGLLDWRQLYDHLMRVTPDHIIFGEISTLNAFAALAALNSGVTGFMCTIHAESPHQAIHRKFDQNIAWAGDVMPRVPEFLTDLIDVVVQIKRTPDGFRRITDIFEPGRDRFILRDGKEA